MSEHSPAYVQRLERRIHNQRVNLRRNWDIVEMRGEYKRAWWPSKSLRRWIALRIDNDALRLERDALALQILTLTNERDTAVAARSTQQ